jgi:hypothetical protein
MNVSKHVCKAVELYPGRLYDVVVAFYKSVNTARVTITQESRYHVHYDYVYSQSEGWVQPLSSDQINMNPKISELLNHGWHKHLQSLILEDVNEA